MHSFKFTIEHLATVRKNKYKTVNKERDQKPIVKHPAKKNQDFS